MRSRDVIRLLEENGWEHVATSGSHYHLKHPTKPGRVTVPHPTKDIKKGTLASIFRQAGLAKPQ